MNRIFGKTKAPPPPPPSLSEASEGIGKRTEHVDAKIAALDKELKGYKDKLKTTRSPAMKQNLQKRAMDVLKRKRMYEGQRDQMMAQQFNMDQASFSIESAKATVETVAAMKAASQDLKKVVQKDLDIDKIQDMTDDMADLMDEFNEINEAMAANYSTPDDIDEADLEAELEFLDDELEAIEEKEAATATPAYLQEPQLPTQPSQVPTAMPSAPTGTATPAVPAKFQ